MVKASQLAQWLRICLPIQEMQEPQLQPLGWEDALDKEMPTHSSILAREISWTEEAGGLQSWDHKELDTTDMHTSG